MTRAIVDVKFEQKCFENKKRNAGEFPEISLEIRRDIIKSLFLAESGHTGGPLGITDVMSVLFFGDYLKYKASDPGWEKRDRFVLSAGHMAPVLYSALARAGYFPMDQLLTLRKLGSRLQGHPCTEHGLPGIETASGSLGQGISIAAGMAMCHKYVDKSLQKVFTISGDGELQEGTCWETAMSAGAHKLDNFCWIVDNNDCQIDGRVKDIMSIYPIAEKFESFGFEVIEINGHDFGQIANAFDKFEENMNAKTGKPFCIIAKTFMGRGVSFMNDKHGWHGIPPNKEQLTKALEELI